MIGYGKCGRTLAGYLQNMFCRTMVWEKDREKAAQAKAAGLKILEERELPRALTLPAFLFQTAPCVVLKKDLLKYIRKDTCIIDIASLPGGLDYPAAKDLGLYTRSRVRESMLLRLQGRSWLRPLFGSYQNLCSRRACHGIKRKEDRSGPYRVFLHV